MIDSIDVSGDGAISFDEFIYLIVTQVEVPEAHQEEPKEDKELNEGDLLDDDEIIQAFKQSVRYW